jgi:acetyl-CoA C-acetyltransferase
MGIGPVPAVAKALKLANLSLADMDLIELNQAFAVQVLVRTREWEFAALDFDLLNVYASGISLGHPVGATGGRILATLARDGRPPGALRPGKQRASGVARGWPRLRACLGDRRSLTY